MNKEIIDLIKYSLNKFVNTSAIYYKYSKSRKILRFFYVNKYDFVSEFLQETRVAYLNRSVNLLKLDKEDQK